MATSFRCILLIFYLSKYSCLHPVLLQYEQNPRLLIQNEQIYKDLVKSPIDTATSYKLNYTLTTDGTQEQKNRIIKLYSTNNINTKFDTFDGKIKFN